MERLTVSRTVEVPRGYKVAFVSDELVEHCYKVAFVSDELVEHCYKVAFVSDELVEHMRAAQDTHGWSPARTIKVHIPESEGLVIEPQLRNVATPED